MAFSIESHLYPSPCSFNENKKNLSSSSTSTDEKTSSTVDKILKKGGRTRWYTDLPSTQERELPVSKAPKTKEKPTPPSRSSTTCLSPIPKLSNNENTPSIRNGNSPVITKLPPGMADIISSTFLPGAKPTLLRSNTSNTTHLSPEPGYSEVDETERDDLSVASKALKPSDKKAPPKPLPRANTTCLSPIPKLSNNENTPSIRNGNSPVIAKLPPDMIGTISSTFHQGTKPAFLRSNTAHLSPEPECSNEEKPFAKNIPPQKNKPKFKPVIAPTPPQRKVSFQIEETIKDLETSSLTTPSTKGILRKTSSFSNIEENKPHNAADPSTKIHSYPESKGKPDEEKKLTDGWDEVDKMINECYEYLNDLSFS